MEEALEADQLETLISNDTGSFKIPAPFSSSANSRIHTAAPATHFFESLNAIVEPIHFLEFSESPGHQSAPVNSKLATTPSPTLEYAPSRETIRAEQPSGSTD